jgi:type I restriction enzyme S subunit
MSVEGADVHEATTYPRGFSESTKWRWPLIPARKLLALNYGRALKADVRRPGIVPVYGTNGQCGWHDAPLSKGPGLILGRKGQGPLGVEWCANDFWVIDTAYFAKTLTPDVDLKYLFQLIKYVGLNHLKDGTSNPTLSRNVFGSQLLPVPSLDDQIAITEVLGAFDDRITLLRETNTTLEAIAMALFKSWFVDFDPVRAKSEGRAPEGMDEARAALFPDGFEESELGLVPRGWRVMPIGDAIEAVGGATPDTKTPAYWEPAIHCWTTPKDLSGIAAPVLLDTERKLSDQGLAKVGSGALPVGTLLLSSRAPIGYLALAQVPLAINQGYIAMLPGGLLPPLYMLFWCQQNMESIKGRANGSTFMEVSKKAFRPIPALVPTPEVVNAFVAVAGTLFDRLIENEKQAQTLATTRDALLPRLISGQLRINELTE